MYKIFVINVGSTSIKLGVFQDETPLFKETVGTEGVKERLSHYQKILDEVLGRYVSSGERFDLIVSRGGLTRPLESGAYLVNEAMCRDLREAHFGWHPSNLGPLLAYEMARRMEIYAIVFDTPVVDEMEPIARVSGLKGIERRAAFHVLNQKAAGRKAAREFNTFYERLNLVIAHLGGGISICAHRKGRMIDGTHGLSEGPFTPQRSGSLPLEGLIDLCFSGRFKGKEELMAYLTGNGGLVSYLGTYEVPEVEARIRSGDREAELILRAMCYQIAKEIGTMGVVLREKPDGVVLTGNLCHSEFIVNEVKSYVESLAPVIVFPGEDELENLALGGLEVLRSGISSSLKEY
ncbi:MAG: butyrate kinase [Thermodesulfobacteriota bacterium]